jgi:hypothetical protein
MNFDLFDLAGFKSRQALKLARVNPLKSGKVGLTYTTNFT